MNNVPPATLDEIKKMFKRGKIPESQFKKDLSKNFGFLGGMLAAIHHQVDGLKAGLVVLAEENDETKKKFQDQQNLISVTILP